MGNWLSIQTAGTVSYNLIDGSCVYRDVKSWELASLCPPRNTTSFVLRRWIEAGEMAFAPPSPSAQAYYIGEILTLAQILVGYEDCSERDEMIENAEYYGTDRLIMTVGGKYFGYHQDDKVIPPQFWAGLRGAHTWA